MGQQSTTSCSVASITTVRRIYSYATYSQPNLSGFAIVPKDLLDSISLAVAWEDGPRIHVVILGKIVVPVHIFVWRIFSSGVFSPGNSTAIGRLFGRTRKHENGVGAVSVCPSRIKLVSLEKQGRTFR